MKLYELTEIYRNIEMTEDLDEQTLNECLSKVNESIEEKVNNIACVLQEMQADIDAYKKQEENFKAKRQAKENTQKRLKEYLKQNMEALGQTKIKTQLFTANIAKNRPSIVIAEGTQLPEQYYKITKTPDKTALQEALKSGEQIQGVTLEQTQSVRIR